MGCNILKKQKTSKYSEDFLAMVDIKMGKESYELYQQLFSEFAVRSPKASNSIAIPMYNFLGLKEDEQLPKKVIKEKIKKLQSESIYEIVMTENKITTCTMISVIDQVEIDFSSKLVTFKIIDNSIPLLLKMTENYPETIYSEISELNSKYGIVLYKLFAMSYKKYSDDKNQSNEHEDIKNPIVTIERLRRITNTEQTYKTSFSNFEKHVLREPIDEINRKTKLNISYEKIKEMGNQIDSIKFFITSNNEQSINI